MKRFVLLCSVLAACGGSHKTVSSVKGDGTMTGTPPVVTISWHFDEAGEDQNGNPQTKVNLVVNGQAIALGEFTGDCHQDASTIPPPADRNAITTAECYWAGGGDQWDVRQEGDTLVVSHAETEEGGEDDPGGVGPFEVVKTIPIAHGAQMAVSPGPKPVSNN